MEVSTITVSLVSCVRVTFIDTELQGIARIKEALEANDWAADDDEAHDLEGVDDDEAFPSTFAAEEAEISMEFAGLKTAVNGGSAVVDALGEEDEAFQVEEMERMISKLQVIKRMHPALLSQSPVYSGCFTQPA